MDTYSRDIKVDLHIHTTASDGTWSPEKLVSEIVSHGIGIFSITDHDSTENIKKASLLADSKGLMFIPGVEADASYDDKNYHILGYGIDPEDIQLNKMLKKNRELMESKDDESIKYLEKKGYCLSLSEYKTYENNRERGGWKALNYLIDKGLCMNHKDFFDLFTEYGNPFEKMTFASIEEAVSTIKNAGGIPVLAHPGAFFYGGEYKYFINAFIDKGIMGIECYHPENTAEVTEYCITLCNSKGLLITGGSDCHGEFVKKRCLGYPEIYLSQLKLGSLL